MTSRACELIRATGLSLIRAWRKREGGRRLGPGIGEAGVVVGRQGSEVRLIIFLGKEVEVDRGMARRGGVLNGIFQVMLAPISSRTLNIGNVYNL